MQSIQDNALAHRYELDVDGEIAYAEYALADGTITFEHTFVPEALRGRGIAKQVIEGALAASRARGLKVVPRCSTFANYMHSHPETQDLLAT